MMITSEQIAKVKEFAQEQFFESENGDENMIHFMFCAIKIVNPWIDDTGRFDFTDEEAVKHYGLENVMNFILNVLKEE